MRILWKMLSVSSAAALLVGALAAQEVKIKRSELPPQVETTVAAQSAGSAIKGFSKETENGETIYELQMVTAGHSKDVSMNAKGEVLEVEEEVSMDHLPAVVRTGLQSKAGTGKITKVESLTKKCRIVAYEAQVNTAGKRSEIQVGPDGAALDHEE